MPPTADSASPQRGKTLAILLGALMLLAATYLGWAMRPPPPLAPQTVVRFVHPLPAGDRLVASRSSAVQFSADAKRLLFAAASSAGETGIYVRRLDRLGAERLPGSEGALLPIPSWDDDLLAFATGDRLLASPIEGGLPRELWRFGDGAEGIGAELAGGGNLVLSNPSPGPLERRTSAGQTESLTLLDRSSGEIAHEMPHLLPGGRGLLFTARRADGTAQVAVVSFAGPGSRRNLVAGSNGQFLAASSASSIGHLVYAHEQKLYAAPFELERFQLLGAAVPVLEGLDGCNFSLAANGTLAWVGQGSEGPEPAIRLVIGWGEEVRRQVPLERSRPG